MHGISQERIQRNDFLSALDTEPVHKKIYNGLLKPVLDLMVSELIKQLGQQVGDKMSELERSLGEKVQRLCAGKFHAEQQPGHAADRSKTTTAHFLSAVGVGVGSARTTSRKKPRISHRDGHVWSKGQISEHKPISLLSYRQAADDANLRPRDDKKVTNDTLQQRVANLEVIVLKTCVLADRRRDEDTSRQ